MTLRNRVLTVTLVFVTLAVVSLALVLSHESPCPEPDPLPGGPEHMQAIVYRCYGSADVLRLEEIARPIAADNDVLVKVRAAAINPLDWHNMTGTPYIMRLSSGLGAPDQTRLGVDFAGTVEAVGRDVTRFKPGDEVFGARNGALAEYVTVREDRSIVLKPPNVSFEQAAAIPVAGITALQGLRDKGRIKPGDKVLINGASGGVGTFAVQIAKSSGAEVTGVSSTRNLELVRSIGADHVIDYTQENFTQGAQRYDVILDNVGNHSLSDTRRALKPDGILVIVSGPKRNLWLGPMTRWLEAIMMSPFVSEELATFIAELNQDDLQVLGDLVRAGQVTPVIDRQYTLDEVPTAIRYLATGRARGKVVVNLESP
jgi:NADPH:quinone reductase-like Zn-dependent oxidoreductase